MLISGFSGMEMRRVYEKYEFEAGYLPQKKVLSLSLLVEPSEKRKANFAYG
jgi:hypothetical protein